ncbi:hypothetical protein MRB53_014320 [Persea americana]|uniref:Uncharacterized protein n=1 Tax=Persea americana TaxID=3435 RepID=A0ACC2KB11_PERAE|nr:hypothetical protein MRB53_014320 [Persea americana]
MFSCCGCGIRPPFFFFVGLFEASFLVFGVHHVLVHLIPSTSVDASELTAGQEDGPFEIWLVSPGFVVLVRLISSTSVEASQLSTSQEDCPAPNPTHPAVYSHPASTV